MIDNRTRRQSDSLRALFDTLATGGREPIVEIEDWRDHLAGNRRLNRSGVGRWFMTALRHEWMPLDIPTPLCAALTDDATSYLETRPGPWATVLGHILRVAGTAGWLASQRGIDEETVYLTALYHDLGKLDEWDTGVPHAELGARYAERDLTGEISARKLLTITEAIRVHPDRPPPSWLAARALHDADKLDKIGATGLIRRISKMEDIEEACLGADRTLYEAETFPRPCLAASTALLQPKLAFARTVERLIDEICP
ncbi:MAG: HD domain-containing protein [Anaerolineae bacterium]|nr:HD domain-containing protein [Anaerolineae bacterium]